jgi:hypothetical protein
LPQCRTIVPIVPLFCNDWDVGHSLDHAAVDSIGGHVVRLVQEPESFPLLNQCTEIFRSVNQLL